MANTFADALGNLRGTILQMGGISTSHGAYDADDAEMDSDTMTTRNGVNIAMFDFDSDFGDLSSDAEGYGGWLNANAFGVLFDDEDNSSDVDSGELETFSLGDATGRNPDMEATWNGAMVGLRQAGGSGDALNVEGDASIEVTISGGAATAAVKITNVMQRGTDTTLPMSLGRLYPATEDAWDELTVTGGGFSSAVSESDISGQFYGSDASEVGGVFDVTAGDTVPTGGGITGFANNDTVIGAFGAKMADE
jgi:hypothetical protein